MSLKAHTHVCAHTHTKKMQWPFQTEQRNSGLRRKSINPANKLCMSPTNPHTLTHTNLKTCVYVSVFQAWIISQGPRLG